MFLPVGRVSGQNQQLWTVVLHMVRCIRDFLKTFVYPFIPYPTKMVELNVVGKRRIDIPTCVAFMAVRIVCACEALPQLASGFAK